MKVAIKSFTDKSSKSNSTIDLSGSAYNTDFNMGLVHQVITSYQTCGRAGTRATKNRSARSGGGKKPWRQKGTGRARAGTSSSPIWVGGGDTFAKEPYDYSKAKKVNKKVYKKAIKCILSKHLKEGTLLIVDEINLKSHKTKNFVKMLDNIGMKKGLILSTQISENLHFASRNIPNISVLECKKYNPVDLYSAKMLVITKEAAEFFLEYLV